MNDTSVRVPCEAMSLIITIRELRLEIKEAQQKQDELVKKTDREYADEAKAGLEQIRESLRKLKLKKPNKKNDERIQNSNKLIDEIREDLNNKYEEIISPSQNRLNELRKQRDSAISELLKLADEPDNIH